MRTCAEGPASVLQCSAKVFLVVDLSVCTFQLKASPQISHPSGHTGAPGAILLLSVGQVGFSLHVGHTMVTQIPGHRLEQGSNQITDSCVPEGIVDITPVPSLGDEHLLLSPPYPRPMTSGYWNFPAVLFPL